MNDEMADDVVTESEVLNLEPVSDEGQDESEVIVTIGEESPPQEEEQAQAPEWVRELRKNYRELQREKRELEEKLKGTTTEVKTSVLGPKPKLDEHDYDTDKYEDALANWYERKREVSEQEAKAQAEAEAANNAWQSKLANYNKAKTELKVKDFDEAEHVVLETLSATQQGIIIKAAKNPAVVVAALGKNPAEAKRLAAITDPIEYTYALAELESKLKVSDRKAPPPETSVVRGTGSSSTVDSTLERLRTEAAKTGDYTRVTQYKMQKRQAK